MSEIDNYPGVKEQLDDTLPDISVSDQTHGQTIIVTQTGPDGGMQSRFQRQQNGTYALVDADNVLGPELHTLAAVRRGGYQASSPEDHASVADVMRDQVGKFSSKNSPTGQNLACVWAVRNIIHSALNRWITHADGTAALGTELEAGFDGELFDEDRLADGAIIISPTQKRHGHIGLLGARTHDGDRLIYSNSSAHGVWMQNWTVKKWYPHYKDELKLKVLFYPIPIAK